MSKTDFNSKYECNNYFEDSDALHAAPFHAQAQSLNSVGIPTYSFSLDHGFNSGDSAALNTIFRPYQVVIVGEGGSHYLTFYQMLQLQFVKFFNNSKELHRFFLEFGHSSATSANNFLATGSPSGLPVKWTHPNQGFWSELYQYNNAKPKDLQLTVMGIDVERTYSYVQALQSFPLIAEQKEEKNSSLQKNIDLLDSNNQDCQYISRANKKLKEIFKEDLGSNASFARTYQADLQLILDNPGSCADVFKNRNKNMYRQFMKMHSLYGESFYYGPLGMAHTLLTGDTFADLLNKSESFQNKVCVINTYCLNCNTEKEEVSNWQLHKVEKEIVEFLVPLCEGNFTLFDLRGHSKLAKKLRKYGQLLIIAKNQH